MAAYAKRLIEVDLPIRAISEHARKDQNIRKGHLHTMHVWWATRPLASCRAVILATLLPDPADPSCPKAFRAEAQRVLKPFTGRDLADPAVLRQSLMEFVADFAGWDAGVNPTYLSAARKLVAAAHPEGPPLVLDPFAGAGSIPFEALRVGANSFAGDLNPIPVLLNKVALEYLPKYGPRLAEGVEKWGKWVLEQARKKLSPYYPADSKGNIPLAYIWARTIACEGPGCGAEVPLLGMLWMSQKAKDPVALRYHGDKKTRQIHVELFKPHSASEVQPGIVKRMAATCPCCGYTTPYKNVREQLTAKRGGAADARLIAVITLDKHGGRHYRLPDDADLKATESATRDLEKTEEAHTGKWSFMPHEPTPPDGTLGYRINKYGIEQWSDVYLTRQALALGTLCRLVGEVGERVMEEINDPGISDAVATCIGLAVSNLAAFSNSVAVWSADHMGKAFMQGSGLAMRPDFAEASPLVPKLVGGLEYALGLVQAFLEREGSVFQHPGTSQSGSATNIPLPDDSVDYVVTDPPYYDAIAYAALSDFCYVWLRRAVGERHLNLFSRELTPKAQECIVDPGPPVDGGPNKDRNYYESTMQAALTEARRTLKPDGVCVVIFAHKGTAGWEALLNALVNAGWTVTASWPIDTENATRMRAKNSAALGSSVHLVCRPRENPDGTLAEWIGDWREVLAELPKRIHEWMPRLSEEGIVGADAIFACLGPALEVFSRYARVEKASGEQVSLRDYLEQVWAAVSQEALRMVFEGADASGFEEDARLTAMWLWTLSTGNGQSAAGVSEDESEEADEEGGGKKKAGGGYTLEYDTARKIAQGLGAHLETLPSVVAVEGDIARLLPVSDRTAHLFGKAEADAPATSRRKKRNNQLKLGFMAELDAAEAESGGWGEKSISKVGETTLDRVHQSMILFAAGRSEAMRRFLVEEGVGRDGRFWTLAQALSALYPASSVEKRWVDGVLARKKGMGF
jgi:adenine-specific DNA methylase